MTLKEKGKCFVKQLYIIILYFFTLAFLQLIFLKGLRSSSLIIQNMAYILIYLILLIIFLFIFRKTIIPDFNDFKKNGKKYIINNFYIYLIGLVMMLLINSIIGQFIGLPENEEANRQILKTLPFFSIINTVILAPIIEEAMTRIILKDTFKNHLIYIILSGLIFGSLHVLFSENALEYIYVIPYGLLGSILATIYYKTNNIWSNIFFHSLHNLIAITAIFIGAIV